MAARYHEPGTVPANVLHFVPPHCPNPECEHHLDPEPVRGWYYSRGLRRVRRKPGVVAQFSCRSCGRWFRSSAFGPDYWKKLPGLQHKIYNQKANGCGQRQCARVLGVSLTTVRRRTRELARQCLLYHVVQRQRLERRLDEPVALDGLRDCAGSQYEPLDLHTPIATKSGFLLDLNLAPLRRSGTMTARQKVVREERDQRLGRPEARAREKRAAEIFRRLDRLFPADRPWTLVTDEEPDYARALAALPPGRVEHKTVSSRARRDARNPLRAVNALHGYMRHAMRDVVRETIAFAKTAVGLLDRAWIFLVIRNNTKGLSERTAEQSRRTPAMVLGLARRPLHGRALFARRLFPRRVGLPPELESAYRGTLRARPNENVKPYIYRFVT